MIRYLFHKYRYFFFTFLCITSKVEAQNKPFITTYYDEQFSEQNNDATTDEKGRLYMANLDGVLYFDGHKWERIEVRLRDGEESREVYRVKYHKGLIFLCGPGYFGYIQNKQVKILSKGGIGKVYEIKIANKGVFFLAGQRVYLYSANGIVSSVETGKGSASFLVDDVLLFTGSGGCQVWDGKQVNKHHKSDSIGKHYPRLVKRYSSKELLCSPYFGGLWLISEESGKIKIWNKELNKKIGRRYINDVKKYKNGYLIATLDLLLFVNNSGEIQQFFEVNGDVRISKIDVNNNVWLLVDGKLEYWELGSNFSLLKTNFFVKQLVWQGDNLYITSSNKIYLVRDSQPIEIFWANEIYSHFKERGKLYFTTSSGIYSVEDSKTKKATSTLAKKVIVVDNRYVVGKHKGVAIYNRQWEKIEEKEIVGGVSNLGIVDNNLWSSGSLPGLHLTKILGGRFGQTKFYSGKKDGLGKNSEQTGIVKHRGGLLFNNPDGVFRYQAGHFVKVLGKDISKEKINFSYIAPINTSNIFVTSQSSIDGGAGVASLDGKVWENTEFRRLGRYEVAQVSRHNGKVMMATSRGVVAYDPKKRSFSIPICILNDSPDSINAYENNNVVLSFSSTYIEGGKEANAFSYRLVGHEWSNWVGDYKKEYTNLREGIYTFQVRCKNIYGIESKVVSYTFTILPPWYRTYWAYAGYLLLLLLFGWVVARAYSYRIHLQKKKLEQEVLLQTKEIREQKEEISQQAEELRVNNEKLEELSHFKEDMTQMIVHDAKHPLTNLVNHSDEKVRQNASQVLLLLESSLEVQKNEQINIQLNLEALPTGNVINDAIRQVSPLAQLRLITISNSIGLDQLIRVDKDYILRVFINLLENSIKYVPTHGKIELSSEEVLDKNNAKMLKVWVKDDGQGISDKLGVNIFNKYTVANKSNRKSTGLGLAFCKMAVEAHGGKIGVLTISENDRGGAAFWFTIPLVDKGESILSQNSQTTHIISPNFNPEDYVLIKDYIPKLRAIPYNYSSDLEAVFDNENREWRGSDDLEAWIDAIPYTGMEEEYERLMSMFESE